MLFWLQSCTEKDPYNPDRYFSKAEQSAMIKQSVRFSAKLPPEATHVTKFDPTFDWYYDVAANECDLRACATAKDGTYYFLMTKKARSIWPAREAIGGIFKENSETRLIEYEEVFRTWKMAEDSLNARALELFNVMTKENDLTPYLSKNKGDRYIEFPDDRFFYNKNEHKWIDTAFDSTVFQK